MRILLPGAVAARAVKPQRACKQDFASGTSTCDDVFMPFPGPAKICNSPSHS